MYSFALESLRGRLNAGHHNVTVMQSLFCNKEATAGRPYFFFHFTANPQMSSARLLSLTRREGELLLGFAVGQPPLPFAVFPEALSFMGFCSEVTLACTIFFASCLHQSTAILSSTSSPVKRRGEMKLDMHIRGSWLATVLQQYLEDEFLQVISAVQKETKVFLAVNTFLFPPSTALLQVSKDSLHCFSQRRLFLSHRRSI